MEGHWVQSISFIHKKICTDSNYNHFMTFSIAICILVNHRLVEQHRDYAHQLLLHFVSKGDQLYGREFLIYNVHSLLHLTRDASRFGDLDFCVSCKFESYMQQLKWKVRTGKSPAVQLVKQILESTAVEKIPVQHQNIYYQHPDNAYTTNEGKHCEVVHVSNKQESTYWCRVYHTHKSLFMQPYDFYLLGFCTMVDTNCEVKVVCATTHSACWNLIHHGGYALFLPLLHYYWGTYIACTVTYMYCCKK
jgi:hypothetical protein